MSNFVLISRSVGCVFCDPKEPIKVCTRFRARILIFNIEVPITKGFPVSLFENSYFHCRLLRAFPLCVLSHTPLIQSHLLSRCTSLPQAESHFSCNLKRMYGALGLLMHILTDFWSLPKHFREHVVLPQSG